MSAVIRSTSEATESSKSSTSLRAHPQHRVRVLPDLGQRGATPSFPLGIEVLFATNLAFDLAHEDKSL